MTTSNDPLDLSSIEMRIAAAEMGTEWVRDMSIRTQPDLPMLPDGWPPRFPTGRLTTTDLNSQHFLPHIGTRQYPFPVTNPCNEVVLPNSTYIVPMDWVPTPVLDTYNLNPLENPNMTTITQPAAAPVVGIPVGVPAQALELQGDAPIPAPTVDPTSDEAKRLEIERRLQEIRGVSGVNFGEVLMQDFRLFPSHVEALVGGIRKTISIIDFKQILDGFIKVDSKIENMQMPFGTFLFGKANGDIQLSCYYPSRKAKLKHQDRHDATPKEFSVVLPNIIISHKIKMEGNEWRVLDTHYFCTDRKVTALPEGEFIYTHNARNGIYQMPLPNFYPEGRMCFGNNTMPKRFFNNLNGLDYYYQIIEIAPFNNDLGIRNVRGTETPRVWFDEMSKMKNFDYTRLAGYVPMAGGAIPANSFAEDAPVTEAAAAAPRTPRAPRAATL